MPSPLHVEAADITHVLVRDDGWHELRDRIRFGPWRIGALEDPIDLGDGFRIVTDFGAVTGRLEAILAVRQAS